MIRPARILISAPALPIDTPGLRRPTIAMVFPQRSVSAVRGKGAKKSTWLPGAKMEEKSNDAGSTPATVTGSLSMVNGRPTIDRSEAKRRSQNPWLNKTALGPCHLHSSAVNCRPSSGSTPSTGKKLQETGTLLRRSGVPCPPRMLSPTP